MRGHEHLPIHQLARGAQQRGAPDVDRSAFDHDIDLDGEETGRMFDVEPRWIATDAAARAALVTELSPRAVAPSDWPRPALAASQSTTCSGWARPCNPEAW